MYDIEKHSEMILVKKAKRGDVKAFAELYGRFYKELYRFALYTMKNMEDAEDVVSEAVLSAFENIRKLKKEESFRSWIFTILANHCKRKFLTQKQTEELPEEMSASHEHKFEEIHDVRQAFQKLEEVDRLIVAGSVLGGYASEEIGEILDMNPATVRSRKSRAMEKLRLMLE